MPRSWKELVSDDDAIAMIREWIALSPLDVQLLDAVPEDGQRALQALEVSTRSPMGALAFHTGGLLIDHTWLRVLGAGCARLPRALDRWNFVNGKPRCERGVLIADDVLGGFFAWFREPRTVHYLPPDSLEWEDSELGYTDWLNWALTDRLTEFYAPFRWEGWQREVAGFSAERTLMIYPPLFTEKSHISERARSPVPTEEAWQLALKWASTIAGV